MGTRTFDGGIWTTYDHISRNRKYSELVALVYSEHYGTDIWYGDNIGGIIHDLNNYYIKFHGLKPNQFTITLARIIG